MNKLEQLHLEAIKMNTYPDSLWGANYVAGVDIAASKSAEITEQIAVEFAEWIADSKKHGWCKQLYEAMIVNKVKTTKELFQEFLKTKQDS
jgi:hypothetical protein